MSFREHALLFLALISLASCGGEDGGQSEGAAPSSEAAGAGYLTDGNAACAAATADLIELVPEMSGFFETEQYPPGAVEPYGAAAAEMADILEALAAELAALEPPGDRELIAGQLSQLPRGRSRCAANRAGGRRDRE